MLQLLAALPLLAPTNDAWMTDLDLGLAEARETNRPVLVYLMQPENALAQEDDAAIFATDEFLVPASKRYVLVRQELPSSLPETLDEETARRLELAQEAGFGGVSVALLMDERGRSFASQHTTYFEEPEPFFAALLAAEKEGRAALQRIDGIADRLAADGEEARRKASEEALALVRETEEVSVLRGAALELLVAVRGLDPTGESGLLERAFAVVLDKEWHDRGTFDAIVAYDPKNEKGWRERAVAAWLRRVTPAQAPPALEALAELEELGFREDGARFLAMKYGCVLAMSVGDNERAIRYAEQAIELDPGDDRGMMLVRMVLQRAKGE